MIVIESEVYMALSKEVKHHILTEYKSNNNVVYRKQLMWLLVYNKWELKHPDHSSTLPISELSISDITLDNWSNYKSKLRRTLYFHDSGAYVNGRVSEYYSFLNKNIKITETKYNVS